MGTSCKSESPGNKGRLKGVLAWMKKHHLPPKLVFFVAGIGSTIWFLIRVIPKPSRAAYPCMRVAAPIMSGFILYLLSLGGFVLSIKKAGKYIRRKKYALVGLFTISSILLLAIFLGHHPKNTFALDQLTSGPDDGPNQPMGTGQGIHPGRVVWVWNPRATNAECVNTYDLIKPENTNQGVVNKMVVDGILKLSGESNLRRSWEALFQAFNLKKTKVNKGYTEGEKIFIKINQGTANGKLRNVNRNGGFELPLKYTDSPKAREGYYGTCETYPSVVLEILRELVYVVGVKPQDIAIGDPISHIFDYNYTVWATEFPEVIYVDNSTSKYGRTRINPTEEDLIFYSDKSQTDKLYDIIEQADYLINVASLKPHGRAGISLTAKNHFGSHARRSAFHLHYSLISPVSMGNPSNNGYRKYRVMVDLMGSRYLGQNTLLYVVDGLYGGGSVETKAPVKYFMPPFNNDWCNSVFLSQDQVALESVCYDFLRTEWNGSYAHNPANNTFETIPDVKGVDDYLHQAADRTNWPEDLDYDPDRSGKPLGSLGVHEHWNNPAKKQYSRNLGNERGIELLSVPDTLVGGSGPGISRPEDWLSEATIPKKPNENISVPQADNSATIPWKLDSQKIDPVIRAKRFYSITVDQDNRKWFLTDAGIVSFDDVNWKSHNENKRIPIEELKCVDYDYSDFGDELWLATPKGAMVVSIPLDARSGATTYYQGNSPILSENVLSVSVGYGSLRWFGTDKGISAFYNDKWLTNDYDRKYPEYLFEDFPITSMATSRNGDSLYIGTLGAGVARVYRNDVDAISGASEYAQWGPIELPSDNVYSIYIARDGTQWFGTDKGAARHTGYHTLENWTVFDTDKGLIDNHVQAITADFLGRIWFGTKAGLSIYNNTSFISFTTKDGLPGNNILCIKVDLEGDVWIGTDEGVCRYSEGNFTSFSN